MVERGSRCKSTLLDIFKYGADKKLIDESSICKVFSEKIIFCYSYIYIYICIYIYTNSKLKILYVMIKNPI